jgi:molybdenum cofactor synthesis domain-containing protein
MPVKIGIAGDTIQELKATIKEALKYDLVVLSGGSSVGTRDLLVDVIEGWGRVLFHGVQVKPGKPTIFAMVEGKPLMGMPGYPTACLINSYLFCPARKWRIAARREIEYRRSPPDAANRTTTIFNCQTGRG